MTSSYIAAHAYKLSLNSDTSRRLRNEDEKQLSRKKMLEENNNSITHSTTMYNNSISQKKRMKISPELIFHENCPENSHTQNPPPPPNVPPPKLGGGTLGGGDTTTTMSSNVNTSTTTPSHRDRLWCPDNSIITHLPGVYTNGECCLMKILPGVDEVTKKWNEDSTKNGNVSNDNNNINNDNSSSSFVNDYVVVISQHDSHEKFNFEPKT